jgi:hypothetical protein
MLIWRGVEVIEKLERETGVEPATSTLENIYTASSIPAVATATGLTSMVYPSLRI